MAVDERNGKAFYRRGQAKLGLKDYDGAMNDLTNALNIFPNDKNVQSKLEIAKKYKMNYLKLERKAFSKIFD